MWRRKYWQRYKQNSAEVLYIHVKGNSDWKKKYRKTFLFIFKIIWGFPKSPVIWIHPYLYEYKKKKNKVK